KKGNGKADKTRHVDGIRLSKPKPNFVYRPVQKTQGENSIMANKAMSSLDATKDAPTWSSMNNCKSTYHKDDINFFIGQLNRGIAIGLAMIDRQLPFEYTIANRSTDVTVPIPYAPAADSTAQVLADWNAVYDAHNEVVCLMLGKEGKSVSSYVLKMKGYVEQLERLGYVLPQELSVGIILNGLTSDFAIFVKNYNMHNMGKTIGKLHALLIEYDKGLPKKPTIPQILAIQGEEEASLHCQFFRKLGLRRERKLKQGALYLYVGNGVHVQVEAIGSFDLAYLMA
ncbi:hypothetical protein Tco_1205171, partial [Tanacetum coccineum]